MDYKAIYYYIRNKQIFYVDDEDDELKTLDFSLLKKPENKIHSFRLFDGYGNSHQDLIRFKKDFNIWVNEIKQVPIQVGRKKKYYRLDYKRYYSHKDAVYYYFSSKLDKEKLERFDKVTEEEFYIFERCLNSGLICLNLDYKNKPTECYGYDFSRFYTNLLLGLRIPSKSGTKETLEDIEMGNLKFGIYRIKINYTNPTFTNIFNFSKENHYNSSTLNYLNQVKDNYGLTFTLLNDDDYDYNAYLYDENDLERGKGLFNDWFNSLEKIRKEYPKNKLIKHLMTSLWGTLCSFKKEYINNDDAENYDVTYLNDEEPSEYKIIKSLDTQYKVVKSNDAYIYGLARIKPFLTAFGRLKIMKFIHDCEIENNLIRIHTDGLVFNKPIDFEAYNLSYYPKPEDKTTGFINYKNAIYGYHQCQNCKNEFRFIDLKYHQC